jgi:hypothetical protein
MQKEKLLEEARRRYPIGSRVKSLYQDLPDTVKEQYHCNYPDGWKKGGPQIWFNGNVVVPTDTAGFMVPCVSQNPAFAEVTNCSCTLFFNLIQKQ